LGAVPDEGHFPRTSNEMAARSEGTAGLLLTCPAAAAVRFPTARPRRYPADAPTTRPHSTTTLRDPRGAATYAVAASSRVFRPTCPRRGGIQRRVPTPSPSPPRRPPATHTARRPTPRRHLAACPDSFAHAPPDNAPRRAHPVNAPLPPPSRSLTAPLPTAARTQNSGSRDSRPSGDDTATTTSSSIALPCRLPGPAVTTRPLLLLLRSHCLAGFQAQR